MAGAREVALKILYRIEYDGAYSNIALKDEPAMADLSGLDRGFVTGLVYGVVSRKRTLDYIISVYSSTKLKKLSKFVLLILRIGIYQIYFMDKVPESAAVNESVKLAKKYAGRSVGFVNGILRNASKKEADIEKAGPGIRYSFPDAICFLFEQDFGKERAGKIMEALNASPEMTVRANITKVSPDTLCTLIEKEGGRAEVSDILPYSVKVSGLDVSTSELYKNGFYTVQDTAASLAADVLSPKSGETVLDMCAAPGGKTSHLCEIMNNEGRIVAFDIYEHKLKLIEDNVKRVGGIVCTCLGDASVFNAEFEGVADKILADVPCSGLGIIRRKPDIKWSYEPSELCELQFEILKNCTWYLKPGGELVYSTCTINERENYGVVKKFLEENSGFEAVDISERIPDALRKETAKEGYITLYPDTDNTDGFFIAKIRKKG